MSAQCKECEARVPFDEWLCAICARNVVARYAKPADPQTDWEALIAIATTALDRADKALDDIIGWSGGGGNWPAQDAHVRVLAALKALRETKKEEP